MKKEGGALSQGGKGRAMFGVGHTGRARRVGLVHEFMGSAYAFGSVVSDVIEKGMLREVARGQLSFAELKLLTLLTRNDSWSIRDVATFLKVSNAAASKAVDRLVRRNLLRRCEAAADRRAVELSLTERSRRLLAAYDVAKDRRLEKVFRQFAPGVVRHAAELLDRLSAGVMNHGGSEEVCLHCGIYFRDKCLLRQLARRNCFFAWKMARDRRKGNQQHGHRHSQS